MHMNLYEILFIVKPSLTSKQVTQMADELLDFLQNDNAIILKKEFWPLRSFVRKIKKHSRGYYILFWVSASVSTIDELNRLMRFKEDILRRLVVKVEKFIPTPEYLLYKDEVKDLDSDNKEDVKVINDDEQVNVHASTNAQNDSIVAPNNSAAQPTENEIN